MFYFKVYTTLAILKKNVKFSLNFHTPVWLLHLWHISVWTSQVQVLSG